MNQFQTLSEAAQFAITRCDFWCFAHSDELYDSESLPNIAKIHDSENIVDEDSFYIVSNSGAIGFTEDCGESIDWLFLREDNPNEVLPSSLMSATAIDFCPKCGAQVKCDAHFCSSCGLKLC